MSLEDLIAQATNRTPGNRCWASSLVGDARHFIDALEGLEAENPGAVNRREVQKILKTEFGVSISAETVRNHLAGDCRCGR